jgi:hypothetical protein
MFTKVLLTRVLLVSLTAAAVSAATVAVMNHQAAGPIMTVPAAATSSATVRPNASVARTTNTNAGGATHGDPGGTSTFNGNDQGTGGPSTPGLTALFKGITVKARSVSAVVHAPAGLAVTNMTEISVLFGNRRVSQNYDRANGTTIAFNYPVGDGKRRNEVVTINLTEKAPSGAIPYHWNRLAVIEPLFEVTVSDLAFTLLSDCDILTASDITLYFGDDRGVFEQDLTMSANQTRRVHKFSRHVPVAKASDGLFAPFVSFDEEDISGFHGRPGDPIGPALLPGTTKHYSYDLTDTRDKFCNARADYIVAINVQMFGSL